VNNAGSCNLGERGIPGLGSEPPPLRQAQGRLSTSLTKTQLWGARHRTNEGRSSFVASHPFSVAAATTRKGWGTELWVFQDWIVEVRVIPNPRIRTWGTRHIRARLLCLVPTKGIS